MRPRMDGPIIPFAKEYLEIDATSGGVPLTASIYRPSSGGHAQMAYVTVEFGQMRYLMDGGDPSFVLFPGAALGIGSTKDNIATGAFYYDIGGTIYYCEAVAAGTSPGDDVIPEDKYGAVALDIGADGTIDAIEATDNATGYNTAALAVAGLPATEAAHIRLGYVTAMKSDGDFTFGTTEFDAANVTAVFTSVDASTPGHIKEAGVDFWLESLDCIAGFRANRTTTSSALICVEYFK